VAFLGGNGLRHYLSACKETQKEVTIEVLRDERDFSGLLAGDNDLSNRRVINARLWFRAQGFI
jgi:hypothetical protein